MNAHESILAINFIPAQILVKFNFLHSKSLFLSHLNFDFTTMLKPSVFDAQMKLNGLQTNEKLVKNKNLVGDDA